MVLMCFEDDLALKNSFYSKIQLKRLKTLRIIFCVTKNVILNEGLSKANKTIGCGEA